MPKVSLYEICLERVSILLRKATWKYCSENPFSNLPTEIVEDLMDLLADESISCTLPLLMSGSLTRLYLYECNLKTERDLFLKVIMTNCFQFLRFLSCRSDEDDHIPLIEILIRSCKRLEEFWSEQYIELDVFENCKELRVLRLSPEGPISDYEIASMRFSVLASLKNLQVVFFSDSMDGDTIANVMQHCPRLISLGYNDSLKGLEKIHGSITRKRKIDCTEVSDHFQLKRCVWGKPKNELDRMENDDVALYKSGFPEKIRIAVSLCPFVEELVIHVSNVDSIKYLKNLERLTSLKISFEECDSYYMTHLIALLKIMGPKLKYLNVLGEQPVLVDSVCDCCPRLEKFKAENLTTAGGSVQPNCNVFLTSLDIKKSDRKALWFLLTSCKGLVELSIIHALCLDDTFLGQIMRLNPLTQLKLCKIIKCRLAQEGFRMILEKAVYLERVEFEEYDPGIEAVVKNLITELNPNIIYEYELYVSDDFGYNF